MGKPAPAPVPARSYRDDPSLDDAVSLHTTRGDYDYDDVPHLGDDDEPPAYTDDLTPSATATPAPATATATATQPPVWDQYPVITRPARQFVFGKPVAQNAVTARLDARLSSDPTVLENYVGGCLALLPPRPVIQLLGTHTETVRRGDKREKKHVTDFDVMLSLQGYLGPASSGWRSETVVENGERAFRGGVWRSRAPGYKRDLEVGDAPTRSLGEWCADFCASSARLRVFRVSRTVSGIDEEALRQRIEALVRSTHYRGHVKVFFPIEDRAVDIYSAHAVNRWRVTPWIRWVFYLSFLWLFTWPLLYFLTKRWEVINVDWAFSRSPSPQQGGGRKTYATVSEEQWFEKHKWLLRRLVIEGHQGEATDMDCERRADDRMTRHESPRFAVGNPRADGVVGMLRAGVAAVGAVQRGFQGDLDGWGGDC